MGYVNEDDTLELIRCIKGQMVELTAAQYAELPASEKNNGSIYFVTDEDGGLHLDDEPMANSGRAVKSGGIYTYTSKIGSGSLTTNAQTLIPAVNELKNDLKPTIVNQTTDISATSTFSCTGASFIIPSNTEYNLQFTLIYAHSQPLEIGIGWSQTSDAPYRMLARTDKSATASICGYAPTSITVYVWARYAAAGSKEACEILGTLRNVS